MNFNEKKKLNNKKSSLSTSTSSSSNIEFPLSTLNVGVKFSDSKNLSHDFNHRRIMTSAIDNMPISEVRKYLGESRKKLNLQSAECPFFATDQLSNRMMIQDFALKFQLGLHNKRHNKGKKSGDNEEDLNSTDDELFSDDYDEEDSPMAQKNPTHSSTPGNNNNNNILSSSSCPNLYALSSFNNLPPTEMSSDHKTLLPCNLNIHSSSSFGSSPYLTSHASTINNTNNTNTNNNTNNTTDHVLPIVKKRGRPKKISSFVANTSEPTHEFKKNKKNLAHGDGSLMEYMKK